MRKDIHALIRDHIDRYGQHIFDIGLSKRDPPGFRPFSYTIGNHQWGMPELLVIGSQDWLGKALNILGKIQRTRGWGFFDGELVSLGSTYPVRLINAGSRGKERFAIQVGVFYDTDDFQVMQVILPDPQGRYPGDLGCEPPYCHQPIIARGEGVS
jgi:hypothetical protein